MTHPLRTRAEALFRRICDDAMDNTITSDEAAITAIESALREQVEMCAKIVEDGVMAKYIDGRGDEREYHTNNPSNVARAIRRRLT